MANIKKIELVDVNYWSASKEWKKMNCKLEDEPVAELTALVLYDDETGFEPGAGYDAPLKWDTFTVGDKPGYTIFGETHDLIPAATKSIRIRYKIKTTSAGTPDTETTSDGYYYQIVRFAVPETGVVSGLVGAITGTITATISINVPGFSIAMASPNAYQTLMEYMTTAEAWELLWGISGGSQPQIIPTAITIGNPISTSVAEHGGCLITIKMNATLPVPTSGNYELTVNFQPNDSGSSMLMGEMTTTATVTVNVASQGDATYFSSDEGLLINISFTS